MIHEADMKYEMAFQTISAAGEARSEAAAAVQSAKEGDEAGAKEHLKKADEYISIAHNLQTDMITEEARGNPVEVNIILVHAQDHLTIAMMAIDHAEEMIEIYGRLLEMERRLPI